MASFDDFAEGIEKKGVDVVTGKEADQFVGYTSTGNYALNWCISNRFLGGYPLGQTTELFGPEGSGKSFLVYRAIAELLGNNDNALAFVDDSENAWNPKFAEKKLGVDVDRVHVASSITVSDHHEVVNYVLNKRAEYEDPPQVIIACDSLAFLSTTHEQKNDFETSKMGDHAKELRRLFRRIRPLLRGNEVVWIATNHETQSMGQFEENESTGGTGFNFGASVRIRLSKPRKIKKDKEVRGVLVRATAKKTRTTYPFRTIELAIPFHNPISPFSGLIPVLMEEGVIEKTGNKIAYNGEDTGIGIQKSNPVKQQYSGEELLNKYPDLLETADQILEEREKEDNDFGELEDD